MLANLIKEMKIYNIRNKKGEITAHSITLKKVKKSHL